MKEVLRMNNGAMSVALAACAAFVHTASGAMPWDQNVPIATVAREVY